MLTAVFEELEVQKGFISTEMSEISSNAYERLNDLIDHEFPLEALPYAELKDLSARCKAHVTPYCNIILECGVMF